SCCNAGNRSGSFHLHVVLRKKDRRNTTMKAFITGISGFVGAGLARRLLKEGHEVHGLVRSSTNLWRLEEIKTSLRLHEGDLLNKESMIRALQVAKPDVVFHPATYGAYPAQKDKRKILETSVFSTLTLLEAAKDVGVSMFLNTGSSSEYGTKDHPMQEGERIDPNSYYAVGKAAQTLLCQHFAHEEKFPVATLRLFSVYGQYEEPGRLVPTVILNAIQGKDISLADPRIARDFIYLEDVVDAYLIATKRPDLAGEIFNVGTGVQTTLNEFAHAVVAETKSGAKIVAGAYEKRDFDTFTWVADMEKTKKLLGFSARYNLTAGLKESIVWFQGHGNYYKK
ncbi:MAG: NAD-dependent epimerase/dehydratase family protein, partial [bacterium]|nr:NAD-dependent epimerase/dehydratase family protein [bacterium]